MSDRRKSTLSVYRLLMRAASASVAHHPTATRTLRRIYRPMLDELWRAQGHSKQGGSSMGGLASSEMYWCHYDVRLNRTLALLVNAASVRGTSSKVVKNLTQMAHSGQAEYQRKSNNGPVWIPDQDDRFYERLASGHLEKTDRNRAGGQGIKWIKKLEEMRAGSRKDPGGEVEVVHGMDVALDEVVAMAELTSQICLGASQNARQVHTISRDT